ncbi:MAG TPA: glycoside hydrolase family 3 C-terminal domain-containing protein [Tepidisphaeraceae bacterium]
MVFLFTTTPARAGDVESRVDSLLQQMTLNEKVRLLCGHDNRFTYPVPRLGIPQLQMSDGPVGAHNDGPDTAYPSSIALAATWNADLAMQFGESIGSDCRARGDNFILGPAMDMYRVPVCGRNSEYLGEDPYLSGTIAARVVRGIQSKGVAATVKHYAGNEQEDHRGTESDEVDERTLREIYMRQFEIVVRDSHPWAVMAAYNRINGTYCTANHWLLTDVLKNEWGFEGIVMSDWGATHDEVGPANAGLDLEMPGGEHFTPAKLLPLIKNGSIPQAAIDDKVRRLLRVMVTMGFLDRPQKDSSIPLDNPRSVQTALEIARQGTVLLKNEGNLLPLDRTRIKSVVIIGPNADPGVVGCGGSSQTEPFHSVSVVAGVQKLVGKTVNVIYLPLTPEQQLDDLAAHSLYQPISADASAPLQAEFFDNKELQGSPKFIRGDKTIHFDWSAQTPPPAGLDVQHFSARWTTKITPPADGNYTFALGSHEGSRLFIDGEQVIDLWAGHPFRQESITRKLTGGKTYNLRIEFFSGWHECSVRFGWGAARPVLDSHQQEKIASADAAIICVGFNTDTESEGFDRPYALTSNQNDLILSVSHLNPHSIVLINSGGNVAMNSWINHIPALLQAWYPGQEGGTALAEILFGDTNPSGHLPATFEKRFQDSPAYKYYPGKDDKVPYKEGIFVGYRYFDAKNIEPRYPFGYGLSYTTFKFSDLKIKPALPDGQEFTATVRVTNTGDRAGGEVAQFYVGQDNPSLPRPPRWLVGYGKVFLMPGESKVRSVTIDPSSLCYWDTALHHWKVDAGGYQLWAGASSRSLGVKAGFAFP